METQAANGSGSVQTAVSSLEKSSSALSKEFGHVLADIEDLIHSSTSLTGDELTRVKGKIVERIASARQSLESSGRTAIAQARKAATVTNEYVKEEPWKAVGIGAALGFFIGLLLARR